MRHWSVIQGWKGGPPGGCETKLKAWCTRWCIHTDILQPFENILIRYICSFYVISVFFSEYLFSVKLHGLGVRIIPKIMVIPRKSKHHWTITTKWITWRRKIRSYFSGGIGVTILLISYVLERYLGKSFIIAMSGVYNMWRGFKVQVKAVLLMSERNESITKDLQCIY